MKEIKKLNTEDIYILTDKDGWLENHPLNVEILNDHPELLTGFKFDDVDCGEGWFENDCIIDSEEVQFFRILEQNTKTVILVSGKKRSGKDHVSGELKKYLESLGERVDLYAYADPMKTILSTTFGITVDQLNNMKNELTPITLNTGDGFKVTNMREILQRFGTEAMQTEFGVGVWRERAENFIKKSKANFILITDFRFPTEMIDDSYLLQIKNVEIDSIAADKHISENLLNDFKFDTIIDNSGKPVFDELKEQFTNIDILHS